MKEEKKTEKEEVRQALNLFHLFFVYIFALDFHHSYYPHSLETTILQAPYSIPMYISTLCCFLSFHCQL